MTPLYADDNGVSLSIGKEDNPDVLVLVFSARGLVGKNEGMRLRRQVRRAEEMLACLGLPPISGSPGTSALTMAWNITSFFDRDAMADTITLKLGPDATSKWLKT